MIWHYPTLKDDGWHPSKDKAWPVGGAYHILQMSISYFTNERNPK